NGKSIQDIFGNEQIGTDLYLGGTVKSFQTSSLGTTYAVDTFPDQRLHLSFNPFDGPFQTAAFQFFPDTSFVSTATPTQVTISGTVKLVESDFVSFDFSGFADSGRFEAVGTGNSVTDFTNFLVTGGIRKNSLLTWTMTAAPAPPGLTLAAIGTLTLVG